MHLYFVLLSVYSTFYTLPVNCTKNSENLLRKEYWEKVYNLPRLKKLNFLFFGSLSEISYLTFKCCVCVDCMDVLGVDHILRGPPNLRIFQALKYMYTLYDI